MPPLHLTSRRDTVPARVLALTLGVLLMMSGRAWGQDPAAVTPRIADVPPVELERVDGALLRGVGFLLRSQSRDGSWGTPRMTKRLNIYAPGSSHDGYRAGTTSLALEGLLRVEAFLRGLPTGRKAVSNPELEALRARLPEISAAIDRCEAWMFENMPELRRSAQDTLYNNWGHAYSIHAFRLMHDRAMPDLSRTDLAARRERIRGQIATQVAKLEAFECVDGGWTYYDFDAPAQHPTFSTLCFTTGTGLVALADARDCGVEVPERLVKRATASILRQRFPNGSYAYGEYTAKSNHIINKPAASLGRAQVCNLALDLWGESDTITQDVYLEWLDRFIAREGWLDIARKRPVPHESWFAVAAYFYYYAHYYAAACVERLESPADQTRLANHQATILLALQEPNGTWWDFPLYDYHLYYGTGMAVTTLVRLRPYLGDPTR